MEVLFIHEPETSICLQTAMLVSLLKKMVVRSVCVFHLSLPPFYLCHIVIRLVTAQG